VTDLPYLDTLTFAEPLYLWLLSVPVMLLLVWTWQLWKRRRDMRRYEEESASVIRHRYGRAGDLTFWIWVLVAAALTIMALARPQVRVQVLQKAGVDVILLQDASASMHVADVTPNRWQRSQAFVRELAEALSWDGDRVALALFAHRAAPQLRLTKDPNALFFFLDHLEERPPFRLEEETTWDTNIAEGLYWGLRLIDTDQALFGKSPNAKAFVVVSDGQAWTGDVRRVLETTRTREIPVHVVGVGTTRGGWIPEPAGEDGELRPSNVRSFLDRDSLRAIARAGRGDYFEIDQSSDRDVAFGLLSAVRRRAPVAGVEESHRDIYWGFLFSAGIVLCLATIFIRQRAELWWQAAAVTAAVLLLVSATIP
jgi:Ca-activated chloride channel homolog